MAIRVPRIFWLSYGIESQLGDSGRSYGYWWYWSKDQMLYTEVSATKLAPGPGDEVTRCAMCSASPLPAAVASVAKNIALR